MKKAYQKNENQKTTSKLDHNQENKVMRLNKYISNSGYSSRREADRLIEQGVVTIDGQVASVGATVSENQEVKVNNELISKKVNHVYIALNKPQGITSTVEKDVEGNIANFMNYEQRIYPIGRLDKDSSGLILLTSDGDIVNKILRAENNNEKEYLVKVNKDITGNFIKNLREGVEITNTKTNKRVKTKPSIVEKIDARNFKIILTQGLNRQIRRMCSEQGYRATKLERIRIMNIELQDLKVGQWRYLSNEELTKLNQIIQNQ